MTEELLFHMYKDAPLESVKRFKEEIKKYKLEDPYRLYIRITNYQVKKYGCRVERTSLYINPEEAKKQHAVARKYRNSRKNYVRGLDYMTKKFLERNDK